LWYFVVYSKFYQNKSNGGQTVTNPYPNLAKVGVEGSNPFARSSKIKLLDTAEYQKSYLVIEAPPQ